MASLLQTAVVYIPPHNKTLALANGLFRKECIPVGSYIKNDTKNPPVPFDVDEPTIDHWINTFKKMQYNGIEVPMPLNHTEDPESRRGTIIDFDKDLNEHGKPALFCTFKFRNEEDEKNLKDTDVSIFVPPKFVDAHNNEYFYPIRHVAFTDYPVIPKLGKMQPIAASYSNSNKKEKKMPFPPKGAKPEDEEKDLEEEKDKAQEGEVDYQQEIKQIADKLGIDTDKVPEDKWCAAINHVIDAVMSDEEGEEDEEDDDDEDKEKGHLAREVHAKEYHPPQGKEMPAQPIAAGFLNIARKSRLSELNELVAQSHITPATRDKLARKYCNDEALSLAFTPEGEVFDDFEELIDALRDNNPVKLNRETSKQQADLSLSYQQVSAKNNPLIANAEARARQAGQ